MNRADLDGTSGYAVEDRGSTGGIVVDDATRIAHKPGTGDDAAAALAAAAQDGDADAVSALIAGGTDVEARSEGRTPLLIAAAAGRGAVVELLINLRANISAVSDTDSQEQPLHAGATARNVRIVRALLKAGGNPNAPQVDGRTPLHIAARLGELEMAELLLAAGADPESADESGITPIDLAKKTDDEELIQLLLDNGD